MPLTSDFTLAAINSTYLLVTILLVILLKSALCSLFDVKLSVVEELKYEYFNVVGKTRQEGMYKTRFAVDRDR